MSTVYDVVDALGVDVELPSSTTTAWFEKTDAKRGFKMDGVVLTMHLTCVRRCSKGSMVARFTIEGNLAGILIIFADTKRKELFMLDASKVSDDAVEQVKTLTDFVSALNGFGAVKYEQSGAKGWARSEG